MDWGVNRTHAHAAPPDVAIAGADGQVFAEIYLTEGTVELDDPGRLDEAAQRFWEKISDLTAAQAGPQCPYDPYPAPARGSSLRRILHLA